MKTTDLKPRPMILPIGIYRKIERERAKYRAILKKDEPKAGNISFEDAVFLSKFISESAFYIEELERHIGEELIDYWQTREHALRILTDVMIEQSPSPSP